MYLLPHGAVAAERHFHRYTLYERLPGPEALASLLRPVPPSALLLDDPAALPRWMLPGDARGLGLVVDMVAATSALAAARAVYWLLQMVNVALLALRFFKAVAFHGKIGLASNAVSSAMKELFDFAVVGTICIFSLGFLVMYLIG